MQNPAVTKNAHTAQYSKSFFCHRSAWLKLAALCGRYFSISLISRLSLRRGIRYLTDHEPYWRLSGENDHNRKLDREVDEFARGADLYIREAQYTEEEDATKRSWGHSTWKDAVDSAHAAQAKRLVLFLHDPMHDDDFLDQVVASCRTYMREQGMTFECAGGGRLPARIDLRSVRQTARRA